MQNEEDFFTAYFKYSGNTEVPQFYHRWSVITSVGAYLGRQFYLRHGHAVLYPNTYCMLIGNSGSRKTAAIKMMKNILTRTGYKNIAADKTTKEKFLMDMSMINSHPEDDILDSNIWEDNIQEDTNETSEIFVVADEFNDFIGNGNIEFISLLGTMWDYSGIYTSRVKNSKSISIPNPTVSILSGNTPTNFSLAFPPEIMGQGFFSRLLLVYGESTGKKIAFPTVPSEEELIHITTKLSNIKDTVAGEAILENTTKKLLEKIYNEWQGIRDVRFDSYSSRRFTHLLKLCLIHAASRYSSIVQEQDVIYANTVLTHTEQLMPKALGEFGKAKHSDVSNKIMQMLDTAIKPIPLKDIWKNVCTDLEKFSDLTELVRNLIIADKVQSTDGGVLPKKRSIQSFSDSTSIDYSLLTEEEKGATR